ncbi:PqqD family protein [Rhodococcus sp. BP-349]|uniref:PqqD family protein n=1 Tax=unclassified Rhodococcus (in: high G+C Gram-positive bacteria) TaxID=192944 RepID=UPI001C9B74D6|nr:MULTISPECIES: PqqD family protein [unclassified Rhodococcus (in: high G+C Gram-positive bacteria)]MBY6539454.1 PqqD family protein [Rhodococcus sp. BP-363]MBY6544218.1 PqqD family protein [Rhodococcus sp. BP-369]MBY6563448.1 PqqD family protein [Rhodococcus sp. BP-370]MBY6577740.1 PqqD family protein [Rhodococcus sp. BP-364]MBY6587041.1 PqqD family protein [Rhodococcus sp. BP-358]
MTTKLAVRESRFTWTQSGSEVVILDLEGSRYFSLNDAGSFVWPLLVAGTTSTALVAALTDEYGIDENVAAKDVDALVTELAAREIVTVTDGTD